MEAPTEPTVMSRKAHYGPSLRRRSGKSKAIVATDRSENVTFLNILTYSFTSEFRHEAFAEGQPKGSTLVTIVSMVRFGTVFRYSTDSVQPRLKKGEGMDGSREAILRRAIEVIENWGWDRGPAFVEGDPVCIGQAVRWR